MTLPMLFYGSREMPRGYNNFRHGHKSAGKRSRIYVVWMNMKARCCNPSNKSFKDYGARGISYDPRWESFNEFLADMGEPPADLTLDRLDNSLGYTKANCAWRTRAAQNLNKRNNVRYELNGKAQTLSEWSRETGVGRVTMLKRIQRGIPLRAALTERGYLRIA